MNISLTEKAQKQYRKLPVNIAHKTDKSFTLLLTNYRHPSLRVRKLSGYDVYEARIDIHYRYIFTIEGEQIFIIAIGMHDTGLGKK